MASRNKFTLNGNTISIVKEGCQEVGSATVRDDYIDEIQSVTWSRSGKYLRSRELGLLHRYVIGKWYGEDVLLDMTKSDFVVDHMDNVGFNCNLENLCFLHNDDNKAKGFTLDKQTAKMRSHIALAMFKDFSTGCFQITMFFNDKATMLENGKRISAIKLLYNTDYRLVINDAKSILDNYELNSKFNLSKLSYCDKKIEYASQLVLTSEEAVEAVAGGGVIQRNGHFYFIMNGMVRMHKIHYDKGWTPENRGIGEENSKA